jgi:hypothetical protein
MDYRKSGVRRLLLRSIAALCLIIAVPAARAAGEDVWVTVVVLDSGSGEPVSARCSFRDSSGHNRFPNIHDCLFHGYAGGYFYCDSSFSIYSATGPAAIRLSKGPEYLPFYESIPVSGDTTVTCLIERMTDMREEGWFSGDVHVHIAHGDEFFDLVPSDAHWMGLAEDLHFVNCLDNGFHFTGEADEASTDECIVYMSEEIRNWVYGHCALPGLKRLIEPDWIGWDHLLREVADSVRSQDGPLIICSHPVTTYDFDEIENWPGSGLCRELPMDAMHRKVDAFEVMSYSNVNGGIETDLWYRLLDCGFRIPPCAGTDAAVNRYPDPPIGGYRTYARCSSSNPDIYEWLGAIASGRTFVTNGPLFRRFVVNNGWVPGDFFSLGSGVHHFFAEVEVECAFPLECVEIVVNGEVVDTLLPGDDPRRIYGIGYFDIDESSWIAARAKGGAASWYTVGGNLFAHTGALYASLRGEPVLRHDAALYFAEWTDSLVGLAHEKGQWPSPSDSIRTLSELGAVRDWYVMLAGLAAGTGGQMEGVVPGIPLVSVYPNPFSSAARIRFEIRGTAFERGGYDPPGASQPVSGADVRIYDVAGRVVRQMEMRSYVSGPLEVEWDGTTDSGRQAASGIYFCRVSSGGHSAGAKILLIR